MLTFRTLAKNILLSHIIHLWIIKLNILTTTTKKDKKAATLSNLLKVYENMLHLQKFQVNKLKKKKPLKITPFLPTLSFLSCLAYGKHGITAVTLEDDAILQALIMMSSSIKLSFISPQPLWMI